MKIINATIDDKSQLLEFLEMRGLAENVWLIHSISDDTIFHDETAGQVYICKDNERIAGVVCVSWYSGRPGEDCMIRLDAEGEEAFNLLLNAIPENKSQLLIAINTGVKQYMDSVPGYERINRDLYYTVNPEQFQPVVISSDNITEVTEERKHLFDGCENPPRWEYRLECSQIDAYILNDRVASSISTSPITPVLPSGYQAISVGALYTQNEHRRRGYARELVSVVTQRILFEGNLPIYWTDQDNIASQALCTSLGYQLYGLEVAYHR